jgi:hypothetical protein
MELAIKFAVKAAIEQAMAEQWGRVEQMEAA